MITYQVKVVKTVHTACDLSAVSSFQASLPLLIVSFRLTAALLVGVHQIIRAPLRIKQEVITFSLQSLCCLLVEDQELAPTVTSTIKEWPFIINYSKY